MTDYASFKHGATTYPLPVMGAGIGGGGASLLRDCDAPLFFVLEFYKHVITRHVGARLLAEAGAVHADIPVAVAETLPINPEAYLTEQHIRFPLLAAYRKSSKFEDIGGKKFSVDDIDVSYVLPPLTAGEAERLLPVLKAVANALDNRTEQGMDPLYTPTGSSTAGTHVWRHAGVAVAGIKGASYGGYTPADDLFFPAVVLQLELKEASDVAVEEFDGFNGGNFNIDLKDPAQGTVVTDFVEVDTHPAPTLSLASPNNGTKAGGTVVTVTGTNFVVNTTPIVWVGNIEATNVVVLSATQVRFTTPAHDAFPTFIADIVVENPDGQEATLTAGFTYTSP